MAQNPEPYGYAYIRRVLGATGDMAGVITAADLDEAWELYPDNWRLSGAYLADSLAARAINDPSSFTAVGDMSVSWNNRAETWLRIAKSLRLEAAEEIERDRIIGGMVSVGLHREFIGDEREYATPRPKRRYF